MTPNLSCTREEFYARRDDRTEQLVDTADYQTAPILITVADDNATTLAGQVMTLTACNITSRFNRNIDVIVSDVALETAVQHADYPMTLAARAQAEMAAADPFGTFRVRDTPADDDAYEAVLANRERANTDRAGDSDCGVWLERACPAERGYRGIHRFFTEPDRSGGCGVFWRE